MNTALLFLRSSENRNTIIAELAPTAIAVMAPVAELPIIIMVAMYMTKARTHAIIISRDLRKSRKDECKKTAIGHVRLVAPTASIRRGVISEP